MKTIKHTSYIRPIKSIGLGLLSLLFVLSLFSCQKKEAKVIKLGFIPLTDCAPIVIAKEMGFFEKEGVNVQVTKEASWANVRDKLITGELDGAHCLYSMPFSVYTGVGGKAGDEMYIAMILNNNGQGITLAKEYCDKIKYGDTASLKAIIEAKQNAGKTFTIAMTFPGGTHDLWIRNWIAANKLDVAKLKIITTPPPQMVANMKVGNMDAYCVGEPWNGTAVAQEIGFTTFATQDMWLNHPEKAFVVSKGFAGDKEELKKVMKAILAACKWLDDAGNRKKAAEILARQSYVNAKAEVLEARLTGEYDLGCLGAKKSFTPETNMVFYREGQTNFPRKTYGIWAMAQYVRFGYLKTAPDYKTIADKLILTDLYKEVCTDMGITVPDDDMKAFSTSIDPTSFDPNDPSVYLKTKGL